MASSSGHKRSRSEDVVAAAVAFKGLGLSTVQVTKVLDIVGNQRGQAGGEEISAPSRRALDKLHLDRYVDDIVIEDLVIEGDPFQLETFMPQFLLQELLDINSYFAEHYLACSELHPPTKDTPWGYWLLSTSLFLVQSCLWITGVRK